MQATKFVIGIRPANKMFRITSRGGEIIDAILALRGVTKGFPEDEYYSSIATNYEQGAFKLANEELGNSLRFDLNNIMFIKDFFDEDKPINVEQCINEFEVLWKVLDEILKVRGIRRIGIVMEHHIPASHASKTLLESITALKGSAHPAKFLMQFEDRHPTREGVAPDIKKSDFINVIHSYYDGELDTDRPTENVINANLDVQRYYSPLLDTGVVSEVKRVYDSFKIERKKFEASLRERGVQK